MANLDALKDTWHSQSGISAQRFEQIASTVRAGSDLLQTTIFRRDMLETCASVVVVVAFAPGLLYAKNWVAWSGFALEVIVGITIPFVLGWARKKPPTAVYEKSFRDFVNVEIDHLERQVRLLRMVTWWYLLPMYVGIVLILVGLTEPRRMVLFELIFVITYLALCTVFFVFVWWLNQSARKNNLQPLLLHYVELRDSLDSGDASSLQLLPDPPSEFLQRAPPKLMTRRQRRVWVFLSAVVVLLVAAAGLATMQSFDPRTGRYLIAAAPVAGFLVLLVSGAWRRPTA